MAFQLFQCNEIRHSGEQPEPVTAYVLQTQYKEVGYMTFIEVARERGLKPKLFYSINEVAQVTGIQERDIRAEVNAGRLKAKVPNGKERGLCIKPEWVDSWADAAD